MQYENHPLNKKSSQSTHYITYVTLTSLHRNEIEMGWAWCRYTKQFKQSQLNVANTHNISVHLPYNIRQMLWYCRWLFYSVRDANHSKGTDKQRRINKMFYIPAGIFTIRNQRREPSKNIYAFSLTNPVNSIAFPFQSVQFQLYIDDIYR